MCLTFTRQKCRISSSYEILENLEKSFIIGNVIQKYLLLQNIKIKKFF